jgi:hypothetical protein
MLASSMVLLEGGEYRRASERTLCLPISENTSYEYFLD